MGTIQCMKQREFLNRLFQISQLSGRPVTVRLFAALGHSLHTMPGGAGITLTGRIKSLAAICPDGRTG